MIEKNLKIDKCFECDSDKDIQITVSGNKVTVQCDSCGSFAGDLNELDVAFDNWNRLNRAKEDEAQNIMFDISNDLICKELSEPYSIV